jgi:hypothetical protein
MSFPLPSAAQKGVLRTELAPPTFNNYEFDGSTFKYGDASTQTPHKGSDGRTSTTGISDPLGKLTGSLMINRWRTAVSVTVDATANTFTTSAAHGLSAGDIVQLSGTTAPGGLSLGVNYYVLSSGLTATVFKLSATAGGSALDPTDAGTSVTVLRPVAVPIVGDVLLNIDTTGPFAPSGAGVYFEVTKSDISGFVAGTPAVVDVELTYFPAKQAAFLAQITATTLTNRDAA